MWPPQVERVTPSQPSLGHSVIEQTVAPAPLGTLFLIAGTWSGTPSPQALPTTSASCPTDQLGDLFATACTDSTLSEPKHCS